MAHSKREYATGGAGFKDYGTSQEAASMVNVSENEAAVLAGLLTVSKFNKINDSFDAATPREIAKFLDWEVTSVRPRITGLMQKGRIKRTEFKKRLPSGRSESYFQIIGPR